MNTEDQIATAERWPVDYDAVMKGDVIPRSKIAEIVGVPLHDHYNLQVASVALQKQIEAALHQRGKPFTVRQKDGDIVILDDGDASHYNRRRFRKGIKDLFLSHERLGGVDRGALPADDLKQHDRALVVQGRLLTSAMGARANVRPIAYRRKTPGLPAPEAT